MKTVVLSMPTYGPVDPEVVESVLSAVMFAARNGYAKWAGPAISKRMGWEAARNRPVEELKEEASIDGIIWQDSDMTVPQDAYARLIDHDKDLVSGLYFQREAPYWPNAYKWDEEKKKFLRIAEYKKDVIVPIGGFGFGICYTSMKLIRRLPADPFRFGEFSEDLTFCKHAMDARVQPYLDTGIRCRHDAGHKWADEALFERFRRILLEAPNGSNVSDGGQKDLRGVHPHAAER